MTRRLTLRSLVVAITAACATPQQSASAAGDVAPSPSSATPPSPPPGMLYIPAGRATCERSRGATCDGETLGGFFIDAHPVEREAYAACVRAGACTPSDWKPQPSSFKPHDVIPWQNGVTYDQAARYCAFRQARLPREGEWNQAFRTEPTRFVPVISTSGNEGEWIDGWYAKHRLKLVSHQGSPYRFGAVATMGFAGTGFRCALSIEGEPTPTAPARTETPPPPPFEPCMCSSICACRGVRMTDEDLADWQRCHAQCQCRPCPPGIP